MLWFHFEDISPILVQLLILGMQNICVNSCQKNCKFYLAICKNSFSSILGKFSYKFNFNTYVNFVQSELCKENPEFLNNSILLENSGFSLQTLYRVRQEFFFTFISMDSNKSAKNFLAHPVVIPVFDLSLSKSYRMESH